MPKLIDVLTLSKQLCPQPIQGKLAYATTDNIVGRIINGYSADAQDVCLLTTHSANALCQVQNHLINNYGYSLFIYDAYRPSSSDGFFSLVITTFERRN